MLHGLEYCMLSFILFGCLPLLASILLLAEMLLASIFGRLDTRMCLLLALMLARILLLAYLMLIASILPMLASILGCLVTSPLARVILLASLLMLAHMFACFGTWSLAGQLDGPSLRYLLGSFCSLA